MLSPARLQPPSQNMKFRFRRGAFLTIKNHLEHICVMILSRIRRKRQRNDWLILYGSLPQMTRALKINESVDAT